MTSWHIFFTADWATSTVETVEVRLRFNAKSGLYDLVEGYWESQLNLHFILMFAPNSAFSNFKSQLNAVSVYLK